MDASQELIEIIDKPRLQIVSNFVEKPNESSTWTNMESTPRKSGIVFTAANISNAIVGSGVITLSYAMGLSGMSLGMIFIVTCAILSDYTVIALVKCACISKKFSYQSVVTEAYGRIGEVIITICQFLVPFFGVMAYGISVSDNITNVLSSFVAEESIYLSRPFIMMFPTVLLIFPLSVLPHLSFLDKLSGLSIIFVFFYSLVIIFKSLNGSYMTYIFPGVWNFGHSTFVRALGIYAFSMSCHFSIIPLYNSLSRPSVKRFSYSSHLAVAFTLLVYLSVSISGFVGFSGQAEGNLFNNYCTDDYLANIARVIFVVTIVFTTPLNILALRETFQHYTSERNKGMKLNVVSAIFGCLIFYIPGSFNIDLGLVGELAGSISAAPMVFIIPAACLIKFYAADIKWYKPRKLILYFIMMFGVCIQIIGTIMSIYQHLLPQKLFIRYWCSNTHTVEQGLDVMTNDVIDLWS